MATGACRLEDRLRQEVLLIEHLAFRERHVGAVEREIVRLPVFAPELPAREVAQQFRPRVLGVPDRDRIGMPGRFIRNERDVRSAEDDLLPLRAILRGQLVCAPRGARDDRHADQVGIELVGDILDPLVIERDLRVQFGRDERRERRQRQWLIAKRLAENAAAMPIKRTFRGNQRDFHNVSTGGLMSPRRAPRASCAWTYRSYESWASLNGAS